MGVQGFPTLKIVKPGKKTGRPVVEDYQGERSAKAIVDTMKMKIPNHVKKITSKDLDAFLSDTKDTAKAILFTEKGTISALFKSVAVDFLGNIVFGQVRDKETAVIERFSPPEFPSLALLKPGNDEAIFFEGELDRAAMIKFLSQIAPPNPDPAPPKTRMPKSKGDKTGDKKGDKKAQKSFESASSAHAASEAKAAAASATEEVLEEGSQPTGEPYVTEPEQAPVVIQELAPPIAALKTPEELTQACLLDKSSTCVLVFVSPGKENPPVSEALASLAEIAHKHSQAKRSLFPFYEIPDENTASGELRKALGLSGKIDIIAINGRRDWLRRYQGEDFSQTALENWVDAIRMGEGAKVMIPAGVIIEEPASETQATGTETEPVPEEPEAEPVEVPEPGGEPAVETVAEPEPAAEPQATEHDEL